MQAPRTAVLPREASSASARSWGQTLRPLRWLVGALIIAALVTLAPQYPYVVDIVYSQGIFAGLVWLFSRATGWIPFSLAETLLVLLVIAILLRVILFVSAMIRKPQRAKRLVRMLCVLIALASFVYIVFYLSWGFHYFRPTYAELAGLDVHPSDKEELIALCNDLTRRANAERRAVEVDEAGVFTVDVDWVLHTMPELYAQGEKLPGLVNATGQAKPVFFSRGLSALNIAGIFIPFTYEANVNIDQPALYIPLSACHEGAHLRGIAREDEANYVAYRICRESSEPTFRYSGTAFAMYTAMNALHGVDAEAYKRIAAKQEPGVLADQRDYAAYWKEFEGKAAELSNQMNDAYLKQNGQTDGVKSYGRVVDLMLAERRATMQ